MWPEEILVIRICVLVRAHALAVQIKLNWNVNFEFTAESIELGNSWVYLLPIKRHYQVSQIKLAGFREGLWNVQDAEKLWSDHRGEDRKQ